jgi:amino acid transporter
MAVASLAFFFFVHAAGVRWFGRLQVAMVALLGLSVAVLVLPGLFAIHPAYYRPFFTHGVSGFAAALPPLFFLYAGFESLAQTAGEVRDSRRRLPGIFLRGLLATACVYVLMSAVAFGALPGERLQASPAPMAEVGARYLHAAAAAFVTLGAVMALATSLNATMLVPSRMALVLVRDGLAPEWIGRISERTGTPVLGLASTLAVSLTLVLSGQVSLALNIAVFALVALYLLHSVALLLLPRWNPALFATVEAAIPLWVQRVAGVVSIVSMAGLLAIQVHADAAVLSATTLRERAATHQLTTVELAAAWGVLGLVLYSLARRRHGAA